MSFSFSTNYGGVSTVDTILIFNANETKKLLQFEGAATTVLEGKDPDLDGKLKEFSDVCIGTKFRVTESSVGDFTQALKTRADIKYWPFQISEICKGLYVSRGKHPPKAEVLAYADFLGHWAREQKQIAKFLREELGQTLFSAKIGLAGLTPDQEKPNQGLMGEVSDLLDQQMARLQSISDEHYPFTLHRFGARSGIEEVFNAHGIDVNWSLLEGLERCVLSKFTSSQALFIFRKLMQGLATIEGASFLPDAFLSQTEDCLTCHLKWKVEAGDPQEILENLTQNWAWPHQILKGLGGVLRTYPLQGNLYGIMVGIPILYCDEYDA